MCLVAVALGAHPDWPLVVVGNRDEFHARPADPMHWWTDPIILAGRDRSAGGAWLGVTPDGRFATVTNYRVPGAHRPGGRTRGELIPAVLDGLDTEALRARGGDYSGFNLLWGDASGCTWVCNETDGLDYPGTGIHALSNGVLDGDWPKVRRARDGLARLLHAPSGPPFEALFDLFADPQQAPDSELPDTGVPRDWERFLSSPFIVGGEYGTRATTVVMVGADQRVRVRERVFAPDGSCDGERRFDWATAPPAG